MHLYFAYGSNLSLEQMQRRCPGSCLLFPARLDGYRLAFGGHAERWQGAVATVEQHPDARVHGLLYTLTDDDLTRLDGFESYPFVYTRGPVPVDVAHDDWTRLRERRLVDGHHPGPVPALTYWFARERPVRPPSDIYSGIIRSAYGAWGFCESLLDDALSRSRPAP